MTAPVASPCISVCELNAEDVCTGCYRNATEITDWILMSDQQRRAVLKRCLQRRIDDGAILLGGVRRG